MNDAEKYWRLGQEIVVKALGEALEGKEPSPEMLRDLDEAAPIVEEELRAVRPRMKGLIKGNFHPWRGVDNVKISGACVLEGHCAAIVRSGIKSIDCQPIKNWETQCLAMLTNKILTDPRKRRAIELWDAAEHSWSQIAAIVDDSMEHDRRSVAAFTQEMHRYAKKMGHPLRIGEVGSKKQHRE